MTWQTPIGDRVLVAIEAEFYRDVVHYAINYLQNTEDYDVEPEFNTGNSLFDNASFNQKVVLLHTCLNALLKPNVPSPKLTHILEAAAYCPFCFLFLKVEEEIGLETEGYWEDEDEDLKYCYRRKVWKPFEELVLPNWLTDAEPDYKAKLKAFNDRSTDREEWESAIENLAGRILFDDHDWQIPSAIPALLDGIDEELSQLVGIDEEYLTNRLPKVSAKQAASALAEIHKMT